MLHLLFSSTIPNSVRGRAVRRGDRSSHSGVLWVDGDELAFDGNDAQVRMPLEGLRMRRNRWMGGAIHFEHRSQPDWSLSTRSDRLLRHPAFRHDEQLVRKTAQTRPHFYFTRRTLRLACILLLLLFVFFPTFRRATTRAGVGLISTGHEIELGEAFYTTMKNKPAMVSDPVINGAVAEIAARLTAALPEEDRRFDYRVHVMQNPAVNAFAMPGGHIVINTGLLQQAQSAEEIAGVIGHEMGHVARRHALSNLVETLGALALTHIVIGHGGNAEGWSVTLMHLSFSRDQETEADECAVKTLRRAGIGVEPLIGFFDRLAKEQSSVKSPELLVLLNTHPLPKDRAAALRRLAAEPFTPVENVGFAFDLAEVQAHIEGLKALPELEGKTDRTH